MILGKEDLSQYNSAKSPWFNVATNGKVDIGIEQGHIQKIGLASEGMYKIVDEWLNSFHGLTIEQKENLIKKLEK